MFYVYVHLLACLCSCFCVALVVILMTMSYPIYADLFFCMVKLFFSFSPQPILRVESLMHLFFFFWFLFCCHFEVLSHYLHCLLTVFLVAGVYVLRLRCVCFETQVCMF